MKTTIKKYPLLISMIISCAIIIASLFVLGFAGMKLGTSLGGGSSFEINVPIGTSTSKMTSEVKDVLKDNKLSFDSATVETKYIAVDDEGNYTKEVLIVKISQKDVSNEVEAKVVSEISAKLGVPTTYISSINNLTSSITAKNVLMIGLAIGIIALALFVFAWIRYHIFAGLTFIVAFLHNIITYLALIILARLELTVASLTIAFILTLVMSIVLIHIFEKYRTEANLHISDKLSVPERMIKAEIDGVKPFVIVASAILVLTIFMLFVPALVVKFIAINLIIALVITAYTSLVIGPATYAALLDFIDVRKKAILSRNDTVNKAIKKKIKNSQKAKEDVKENDLKDEKKEVKKSSSKKNSKSKK